MRVKVDEIDPDGRNINQLTLKTTILDDAVRKQSWCWESIDGTARCTPWSTHVGL